MKLSAVKSAGDRCCRWLWRQHSPRRWRVRRIPAIRRRSSGRRWPPRWASPERDATEKPGVLIREMMLQPGMTVADIGTGIGYMLPFLSRRVGASGRVIAEDIYDDFLAAAKQRAENQNLHNVTFVKGTDTDCNLPEGQVDMVLALDVYHHFDYPREDAGGHS